MNRVLVFGPSGYDKIDFVKRLFRVGKIGREQISGEVTPEGKQSGVIVEELELQTKYYRATIGVFIDEPETNDPQKYVEWIEELSSSEMKELRDEVQLLLVLFPGSEELYEEVTSGPLSKLNTLLDSEHCAVHTESLQWDGEILAANTADSAVLLAEARNTLECVVWRNIELLDTEETIAGKAEKYLQDQNADVSDLDTEKELLQFEEDLARLRNARARHFAANADGEKAGLSTEEKQLVKTVLGHVVGEEESSLDNI